MNDYEDGRGQSALLIATGAKLEEEWERHDVATAARRLMDPLVSFTAGHDLTVVHYGSWARIMRTTFGEFFTSASLAERPPCGPGANLSGALHGALSQRDGDGQLNVFAVSDFHIDPEEIGRVRRVLAFARNVTLVAVRIGTNRDGMGQAHELDEFQSGQADTVEAVYCHDGRGRDVGHDLAAQVINRMQALRARRVPAVV